MIVQRVNPLNIDPGENETVSSTAHLKRPVQSITMGVRIGDTKEVNIGYIQKFNWNQSRPTSDVYQIEPCVDGTFGVVTSDLMNGVNSFYASKYFPGEVIEIIPGKAGPAEITLDRAVLYGSNLMSALMYVEGAGVESASTGEVGDFADATAFGGDAMQYVSLIQQVRPIFIKQVVYNPISGIPQWGRKFERVWIESWGEEIPDASKNEIVVENMKLKATRIRPYNPPSTSSSGQK